MFELPAPGSAPPVAFDDDASATTPSAAPPIDDVGRLFNDYRAYVAKIGRRILGPTSEVDDLIQDVFLATVRDALGNGIADGERAEADPKLMGPRERW